MTVGSLSHAGGIVAQVGHHVPYLGQGQGGAQRIAEHLLLVSIGISRVGGHELLERRIVGWRLGLNPAAANRAVELAGSLMSG